ncbi:glycoside hydrolase family 65 [Mobilitalea sibirica]|uniref:Glycoside hydrolase family 65 n=1 Tax=Mobilitalea sibirica TaxID=1462919 RepID=A0A8J7KSP5_9FIRM|nr:glycoside hydrolase family 65 [Mobilitalea sibirica]MBH1940506.1 glycoside hydrolase family 65 [Mobilitalea sibirica]
MPINRYSLVTRHNPKLNHIDVRSPFTVGNGEFAYTVDITGMQSLYDYYKENDNPLCTLSQWGWHTTPVSSDRYSYTLQDVEMTEYDYAGRKVTYAVECKKGNEEVYYWLRQNPHRMNLGRLGLIYKGKCIQPEDLSDIHQSLNLYTGTIESNFLLDGVKCKVFTCCHHSKDAIAIQIESDLLKEGSLKIMLSFPYGSADITASDWEKVDKHETIVINSIDHTSLLVNRRLDRDAYYVGVKSDNEITYDVKDNHKIVIGSSGQDEIAFSTTFSKEPIQDLSTYDEALDSSKLGWKDFWENGGAIDLHKSKDERALELERRIVLSQYVSVVNSCGSMPPQETGLTCNSWHGKFHLEMYLWHLAYLPLWGRTELLKRSLGWYKEHLKEAKDNASRNGFKGAKWPKQVAYDAVDSPSPIATLLIWQQPHIIYMLEMVYQCNPCDTLLKEYWEVMKETADFMADYAVKNPITGKYELVAPLIPAQEAHNPLTTHNPTYELEYWRFTLRIAADWAKRIGKEEQGYEWLEISNHMADLPVKDGVYLAHENCPDTFTKFNKDHPSMLAAYGLIYSDRVDKNIMKNTVEATMKGWDFATTWGWDFAMIAMTATRLKDPDTAIESLLMNTPNNQYAASGNNTQGLRKDLPLYLPGNGSLLLAVAMMAAGYSGCKEDTPGFPKNGMWQIEVENIAPFPY